MSTRRHPRRHRWMARLAVLAVLAGIVGLGSNTAPAAADPDDTLEVLSLQFGDYDADVESFLQVCPTKVPGPPGGPPDVCLYQPNLTFPPAFLVNATPDNDVPFGNTALDCGPPCAADVAKGIWLARVHVSETLTEGDTITIAGPAGTVFSDDRRDYVLAEIDTDENTDAENQPGEFEHQPEHPNFVNRHPAGNRVTLAVPIDEVRDDEYLYVWMANVTNPPAGTYSGFGFRFETSQQATFPGWVGEDVVFEADAPIHRNATLAPDRPTVVAGEEVTVIATLRDRHGNPFEGSNVLIEPVTGAASLVGSPTTASGADGAVRFTFTDRRAEVVTFRALALDEGFLFPTTPASVQFVPAAPAPVHSEVRADPGVAPADGVTTALIEVRLADEFANPNRNDEIILVPQPVPGGPSNVFTAGTVAAAPGSVCPAPVHDVPGVACARTVVTHPVLVDPDGDPVRQAVAQFLVSSPHAEQVRFTVTDLTKGTPLGEHATVRFVATAPASNSISPVNQSVTADGTATGSITVALRDANGNPVTGIDVTLQPSGGDATIDDDLLATGADGQARFTVRDTTVETVGFTATYAGTVSGTPVSGTVPGTATVAFVPGAVSASRSTVVASPTSRLADGQAAATVLVSLEDSAGRPAPGLDVEVRPNLGSDASVTAIALPVGTSGCPTQVPAGRSDCHGQAAFRTVDSTIETVTYTATVPAGGVTIAQTTTVSFTDAPDIDRSSMAAAPSSVVANGTAASTITVTLRAADGSPVAGKQLCLTQGAGALPGDPPCPSGSAGPSTVTPVLVPMSGSGCAEQAPAGTTDCQGRARFAATSTSAGAVTYGVVDLTDFPDVPLGPSATVTFTAVPNEAGRSTVETDVVVAIANGGTTQTGIATATVTLRDGAGTPLPGNGVTLGQEASTHAEITAVAIPASVSGCATQAPPGSADCNGQAAFEVTDATPEAVRLRATDTTTGVTITQTATVTFLPDEAAVSTVVAHPTEVFADGGTTPAGVATVTVTLDPGATPLVGHDVLLLQSSGGHASRVATVVPTTVSGCAVQQPAGTSDCNGTVVFAVTDTTVETVTFTAFDLTTGVRIDQTATVRFLERPPRISALAPASGPPAGGTVVTITGAGFATGAGATTVAFGGVPATAVTCSSSTSCRATAPARAAAGPVDVVVTTSSGPSTPTTPGANRYTYVSAPPTVTQVSPASGPRAGGTVVTITGTNLAGATTVAFGTANVPVQSIDPGGTRVTATTPASLAGAVDVRVTTPGGTSATAPAARFTFTNPPAPNRCAGKTGLALVLCQLGL